MLLPQLLWYQWNLGTENPHPGRLSACSNKIHVGCSKNAYLDKLVSTLKDKASNHKEKE